MFGLTCFWDCRFSQSTRCIPVVPEGQRDHTRCIPVVPEGQRDHTRCIPVVPEGQRDHTSCMPIVPEGQRDHSPAFQRRESYVVNNQSWRDG